MMLYNVIKTWFDTVHTIWMYKCLVDHDYPGITIQYVNSNLCIFINITYKFGFDWINMARVMVNQTFIYLYDAYCVKPYLYNIT